MAERQFALVTGASTGIGYELAIRCARNGFDLRIAAGEPATHEAAQKIRTNGAAVEFLEADLATDNGVRALCEAARGGWWMPRWRMPAVAFMPFSARTGATYGV